MIQIPPLRLLSLDDARDVMSCGHRKVKAEILEGRVSFVWTGSRFLVFAGSLTVKPKPEPRRSQRRGEDEIVQDLRELGVLR